jgi:leucyl-tRNA synthetase
MNPITPHLSEEMNELGDYVKGLVSAAEWPKTDESKISLKSEAGENLIKETQESMRNVLKLAKLEQPHKYTLFVAEKWMYPLFEMLSSEIKVTRNIGEIMRKALAIPGIDAGKVSKLVPMLLKDVSKLPPIVISPEEELKVMNEAKEYLSNEFSCQVEIISADESSLPKAKSAMPGKVGILAE